MKPIFLINGSTKPSIEVSCWLAMSDQNTWPCLVHKIFFFYFSFFNVLHKLKILILAKLVPFKIYTLTTYQEYQLYLMFLSQLKLKFQKPFTNKNNLESDK